MAYPASKTILAELVKKTDADMLQMKSNLQQRKNALAAGNVSAEEILGIHRSLRRLHAQFTDVKDTPGIGPYVQEQKGDDTLDVVAEYNTVLAAMDATADWIAANMPTSNVGGTDYLVISTLPAESTDVSWRTFTPAQTAGLRTAIDTIINGIS